jgi:hypothetical protein
LQKNPGLSACTDSETAAWLAGRAASPRIIKPPLKRPDTSQQVHKEKTMPRISNRPALRTGAADNGQPRNGPPEESPDDDDALELPVEPDEGTPLIPDDERVVNVPS